MNDKGIGKRINAARKSRHLTAEQLSEVCNINSTYLRQIEGGKKTPSLPVFIDICNALHVSPNLLLQDHLLENEISFIQEIEDLWKKASPNTQEIVFSIIKVVLENSLD